MVGSRENDPGRRHGRDSVLFCSTVSQRLIVMHIFTVAGAADDPALAEAELLGDLLGRRQVPGRLYV